MEIQWNGSLPFRSNRPANGWGARDKGRHCRFSRERLSLDRNFVAPTVQRWRRETRIEQRDVVALSMADDPRMCWSSSGHATVPGYKPSSLRTGYGRQSDPSKVSIILMRPPQHWHGGGSCLRLRDSSSSSLGRSARATGAASKLRQSASLLARWPFAKRP